jgi:hypothetical protein
METFKVQILPSPTIELSKNKNKKALNDRVVQCYCDSKAFVISTADRYSFCPLGGNGIHKIPS